MNRLLKKTFFLGFVLLLALALVVPALADSPAGGEPAGADAVAESQEEGSVIGMKAIAVALAIGIAAGGGGIGMGLATAKSAEGISRQPEAESKIRTMMMLGLVFIETAIIYALLVVILIIFVL